MIKITIPGEPTPQNVGKVGRWKAKDGRQGTTIRQPSKVITYKLMVQEVMRRAVWSACGPAAHAAVVLEGRALFSNQPILLCISAIFSLPVALHRKRNPRPRTPHIGRYGNCDNLTKAIADAGEGILWEDDGQIFDLHVEKWWGAQGEAARVILAAWPVSEEPRNLLASRRNEVNDEQLTIGGQHA
jgi:hypothetical protein